MITIRAVPNKMIKENNRFLRARKENINSLLGVAMKKGPKGKVKGLKDLISGFNPFPNDKF